MRFDQLLSGGDLRSIGNSNTAVTSVRNQSDFDELFQCMFGDDRIVVMRAADAVEKITAHHPEYLRSHTDDLLQLAHTENHKEVLWHLALLIGRISLNEREFQLALKLLISWVNDKSQSKIVRVNALQTLYEFTQKGKYSMHQFKKLMNDLETENIPSLNARIKAFKSTIAGM
jgi:hypothetical protein